MASPPPKSGSKSKKERASEKVRVKAEPGNSSTPRSTSKAGGSGKKRKPLQDRNGDQIPIKAEPQSAGKDSGEAAQPHRRAVANWSDDDE